MALTVEQFSKNNNKKFILEQFNQLVFAIDRDVIKKYTATSLQGSSYKQIAKATEVAIKAIRAVLAAEGYVSAINNYIGVLNRELDNGNLDSGIEAEVRTLTTDIYEVAINKIIKRDPKYTSTPKQLDDKELVDNHIKIKGVMEEVINDPSLLEEARKDKDLQSIVNSVKEALGKKDNKPGGLYNLVPRLAASVANNNKLSGVLSKLNTISGLAVASTISRNTKSLEIPPQAPAPPPKPEPGDSKICEPITNERWGVRFRFLDKPPELTGQCMAEDGTSGKQTWDMKDWFLQLLPAMQSVVPRQGARDVPNAGPGLSFRFKNNMVKHKIPGNQPVYQMMGVDSTIITFVGTFTGDGGLGYISKVDIEDGELVQEAIEALNEWDASRRAGKNITDDKGRVKKYGGIYEYFGSNVSDHPNAMFNPIYHVRNRALNPGGDKSDKLVGSNERGSFMDNSILRRGFFERDGCPGQCPPPSWRSKPKKHSDNAGSAYNWGSMGYWPDGEAYGDIGNVSQTDTHKLTYIAAYLDAYHEMVSFYKFAVQGGKLMEITINLRKTHDGLKPRIADKRALKNRGNYNSGLRSDTIDPLRDMHTGNPTFKGYLKSMSTWAQYSDRVWYVMEFEVVDHGLQGKKAVNLTNKVVNDKDNAQLIGVDSYSLREGKDSGGLSDAIATIKNSNPTKEIVITPTYDKNKRIHLLKDGLIKDENNKFLTYSQVESDLCGLYSVTPSDNCNKLRDWYDSTKVLYFNANPKLNPKDQLELLNKDGTKLILDSSGDAYLSKDGEYDLTKDKVKDPSVYINKIKDQLNPAQRAALEEWQNTHSLNNEPTATPTPSTTPLPTPPLSKPAPIWIR